MNSNLRRALISATKMVLGPLVAHSVMNIDNSNQEAILREKRLARKELLESEAFKKAMPSVQIRMLETLDD